MWWPVLGPPTSFWERSTARLSTPAPLSHAIAAVTRSEIYRTARALSREAFRVDSHDALLAGPVRISERRDARGDRQARRVEYPRSHRNARLLLDAAPKARRPVPYPGLHEYFLHAARRQRTFSACAETPRNRKQASLAQRSFLARRSRVHRRLHRRACDSGELRLSRKSRSLENRHDFRATRTGQAAEARLRDFRRDSRAPSGRSRGNQPPLRNSEFEQDRCLPAARRLSGSRKSPEADVARPDYRRSEKVESSRPRWRRFSRRNEMELRSQGNRRQAEIHHRQWRRKRTRHK